MTTLKNIGKKIAVARKKEGLTQEDLAGMAEMDRSYLSEIENGHKNMSVLSLLKIAEALKVKPSKLLEDIHGS
jgi:transcriptional regulator with XRE-family HTH domain